MLDFLRPSNLFVIALVIGVLAVLAKRRWGTILLSVIAAAALFVALFPVGEWMLVPLETRFPQPNPMPAHVDGIIVLGGAVRPFWTYRHNQPNLNEHAERMTEAVALARRYPRVPLVFTGGYRDKISESDVARMFFREQGIDMSRVVLERKSRTTYGNAIYTRALIKPRPDQTWVLVTTAYHMPRSVGVFRKAGWTHLIPYPVDYETPGYISGDVSFYFGDNLKRLDDAVRAWVALAAYYLQGRTDALVPGPLAPAGDQSAP